MHRFCERCERDTLDGNLFCQDPDCPAEKGYTLLEYGEYLGDLKITKFLRVWRTAALYEAERDGEPVLLKIANSGEANADRLRREATVLQSISPRRESFRGRIRSFLPSSSPVIPVPLAPYPGRFRRPYGEITHRGEARVFSVYEHAEGKILSDLMLEIPQIWHTQAAWIIITLANALRPLAARNRCHLSLTPDVIMVRRDKDGILRPMLLDLGFALEVSEASGLSDWARVCEPAYTAPELLANSRNGSHSLSADVYSLGMILYEMLAGKPAFEYKLRRDDQLREEILHVRKPVSVGRPELEQSGVASVLEQAVSPSERYGNVIDFSKALQQIYSTPPAERRKTPGRTYLLIAILGVILLIVGIIAGITLLRVLAG